MKRIWITLVVLGLAGGTYCVLAALDAARAHALQGQCLNNLKQISLAMKLYAVDNHDQWPPDLQSIVGCHGYCTNPAVFVCPRTGHKPGSMSQIDQWTDYTFMRPTNGMHTNDQGVAAYCLPKNHDGDFGLILFNGGRVSITPAKDFWPVVRTSETLSPADFWKRIQ